MRYPAAVENLCHAYKNFPVYNDLTMYFEQGKIYGILGKNGVGKTTLIKILMGFLQPVSGTCTVFGEPSHALSAAARGRIALLFERHLAYEFFSIEQTEKYAARFYSNWNRDIFYDLVSRLRLPYSHKIAHMSEGQRSQVVLGLLLAQQAELLILDDYSMGLDAGYRSLFIDYLLEYLKKRQATVILTSHVVQDMERFVDDVLFLEKGGRTRHFVLSGFMRDFCCCRVRHRASDYESIAAKTAALAKDPVIKNVEIHDGYVEIFSFAQPQAVQALLTDTVFEAESFEQVPMSLEEAFIGYTGRY